MIARIWRGWAPLATADDYQRHYETEVSGHLRAVSGFRGARLLRRDDGQEVTFTSITFFTSLDAIRGFAGDDFELAVVEETTRQALSRAGLISPGSCRPGMIAFNSQRHHRGRRDVLREWRWRRSIKSWDCGPTSR